MRPSTLAELADTAGIPVPEIRGYGSLQRLLRDLRGGVPGAADPRRLRPARLRGRRGQRARRRGVGGAVVLRAAPPQPLRRGRGDRRHGARRRCHAAGEQLGVGVGLMLAADRTVEPSVAVEQARLAATRADRGIVSFGLANDEAIGPPEPFAEAFAIAKDAGLLSTPHAGELAGPGVGVGRARHAAARPPPARRALDRGPRAGEAPRRLRHRARRVPHVEPAAVGVPVARRAPAARSCSTPGSRAASTATTRCCSGPAARTSTSSPAPRWASTTPRSASVGARVDRRDRARPTRSRRRRCARSTTGSRPPERQRPRHTATTAASAATTGSGHA